MAANLDLANMAKNHCTGSRKAHYALNTKFNRLHQATLTQYENKRKPKFSLASFLITKPILKKSVDMALISCLSMPNDSKY